jgi:alkylation response protein AidB-like acyl-CoA dehydrogenase
MLAVDRRTSRMDLIERFPAGKAWATEESLAVARMVQRWSDRELIAKRQTLRESYDELLLPAYTTLTLELGLQRYLWPTKGEEAPDPVEAALTLTLAAEQVGRGDVGLAWLLAGLLAPSAALTLGPDAPTAEARAALEPLLAGGPEQPQIVALVPPVLDLGGDDDAPRFDGRRLQATARRDGEGWIVTAAAARPLAAGGTATLLALLCHVEGDGEPSPAWALIPADAEGVRRGEPILQAGLTASRNAPVTLDQVRAPAAALTLAGTAACQSLLSWHDLLAAAACVGALAAGHEILADWGDNRVIKGKGQRFKDNPLCAGQMADLSQRIALCRPLVLDLAHRLARQDLYGPAGQAAQRLQAQAVAHHVAASAMTGLDHAMELMGSAGYATEWNLERHWRDVKTVQVQLGSAVLGRVAAARHHYDAKVI